MSYSFNYGEKANLNGHLGTIKSIWLDSNGERMVRIEFDDQSLIPPDMEISESYLKPVKVNLDTLYNYKYGSKMWYNKEVECPNCGTTWNKMEHPIYGKKVIWYDCLKCKIRKEDV